MSYMHFHLSHYSILFYAIHSFEIYNETNGAYTKEGLFALSEYIFGVINGQEHCKQIHHQL